MQAYMKGKAYCEKKTPLNSKNAITSVCYNLNQIIEEIKVSSQTSVGLEPKSLKKFFK